MLVCTRMQGARFRWVGNGRLKSFSQESLIHEARRHAVIVNMDSWNASSSRMGFVLRAACSKYCEVMQVVSE